MAVNLEPLDSLRFYELGPILERIGPDRLELVNTETEIKNIYRVLRVLEPLIRAIVARGAQPLIQTLLEPAIDTTGIVEKLDDLSDVTIIGTPTTGEILVFSNNMWAGQHTFALPIAGGVPPQISNAVNIDQKSDVFPPFLRFQRSRDERFADPGNIVKSGDELGRIQFEGLLVEETFSHFNAAQISAFATEDFSFAGTGSKLAFYTIDNGSTTLDLRMTIDQDGTVIVAQGLTADTFSATTTLTGTELISTVADGTAPITVTSTTMVDNLNVRSLAADPTGAKTPRDWDTVEYTRQAPLSCVGLTGVSLAWLTGTTGPSLAAVATGTPPAQSAHYAGRIPASWKAASTVTLKWRFYNASTQTGTNNVLWRVQYNSPGSSGTVGAADTGAPTSNLALNQASGTIIEESLVLSNIAADDLLNVTLSVDNAAGTTATGNMVILDCPWVEITLQGVPDTGAAA